MVGIDRFSAFFELIPYTYPYLLFFFIVLITLLLKLEYKNKFFDFFLILLFVIFAGFKQPFTWDLENYCYMYHNPEILSYTFIEPSFIILVKILNYFSDDCNILFVIYQFLTIFFIYLTIRRLPPKHQIVAWIIYISLPFLFLNSFGVAIRQSLAISILLYAFSFLYYFNNKKLFLILSLLSGFVHYSAFIGSTFLYLVYYFLHKLNLSIYCKRKLLIILFSSVILSLLLPIHSLITNVLVYLSQWIPFLEKYASYLTETENLPSIKLIVYLLISFTALVVSTKIKNKEIIDFSIFFVIGTLFLFLFKNFSPASRIYFYFSMLQLFLIPKIIEHLKPKLIIYFTVFIFYFLQFIYGLFFIDPAYGNYAFLPYKGLIIEIFK